MSDPHRAEKDSAFLIFVLFALLSIFLYLIFYPPAATCECSMAANHECLPR